MRKKIFIIIAPILAVALLLAGCGGGDDTSRPAPKVTNTMPGTQPAAPGRQQAPNARVTDVRMIIAGLQNDLVPFEKGLTEEQQSRIAEVYNQDVPNDMRDVFGVLTTEQKDVLVSKIRTWLAESDHPFTDEQVARYMAIGPGSEDQAPTQIMTREQIQTILQAAQASMRQQQQ